MNSLELFEDLQKCFIYYLKNQKNLSEKTVLNYLTDLNHFYEFLKLIPILELREITPRVIREYLAQLYEAGYAHNTIARRLACLRAFFKYLLKIRIIETNPLTLIRAPRGIKRLPQFLYLKEVNILLSSVNQNNILGLRDNALLELLYSSGLRIGEVAQVNIGDLDFALCCLLVKGKGKRERVVPFGLYAAMALKTYLTKARPHLIGKAEVLPEEPFFVNWRGQRLTTRGIYAIVKKYLKRVDLTRNLTPHAIRHTFATHLLDGGADLRVVQELLGHSRMSSTQIYTHVSRERIKTVYEKAHPRANLLK